MNRHDAIFLSSAYFPSVQYFHYINISKVICIEAHENYIKQTYRNRCEIYSANGKLALTIPVIKVHGNHTLIKDIIIDKKEIWHLNHWRAIESAYNSSPFFLHYKDDLLKIYKDIPERLLDFNNLILHHLINLLDIKVEIRLTEEYHKNRSGDSDKRYKLSPKHENSDFLFPQYPQVFREKFGFLKNLSVLDLLFNEGPAAKDYINSLHYQD